MSAVLAPFEMNQLYQHDPNVPRLAVRAPKEHIDRTEYYHRLDVALRKRLTHARSVMEKAQHVYSQRLAQYNLEEAAAKARNLAAAPPLKRVSSAASQEPASPVYFADELPPSPALYFEDADEQWARQGFLRVTDFMPEVKEEQDDRMDLEHQPAPPTEAENFLHDTLAWYRDLPKELMSPGDLLACDRLFDSSRDAALPHHAAELRASARVLVGVSGEDLATAHAHAAEAKASFLACRQDYVQFRSAMVANRFYAATLLQHWQTAIQPAQRHALLLAARASLPPLPALVLTLDEQHTLHNPEYARETYATLAAAGAAYSRSNTLFKALQSKCLSTTGM